MQILYTKISKINQNPNQTRANMLDNLFFFAYNDLNRRKSVSKFCKSPIESRGRWKPGGRGRTEWALRAIRKGNPPVCAPE